MEKQQKIKHKKHSKKQNSSWMKHAGVAKNNHVLLYGDVSKKQVKHTLRKVAPNGKVYVIGRNKQMVKLKKLLSGKYKSRVILNPFFNNLPENSLHHILIANASIDLKVIKPLALKAHTILKPQGQLIVIDPKIAPEALITLENDIPWFRHKTGEKILIFDKI